MAAKQQQNTQRLHNLRLSFLFVFYLICFYFEGRALLYILWLLLGPRLAIWTFCVSVWPNCRRDCPSMGPAVRGAIKNRIRNRSTCSRRWTEWRTRSDWQVRRDSSNNNKFGVGWGVVWGSDRLANALQRERQSRQRWRSCEWCNSIILNTYYLCLALQYVCF